MHVDITYLQAILQFSPAEKKCALKQRAVFAQGPQNNNLFSINFEQILNFILMFFY